jgi:sugar phosphate isomerase/epimerase
MAVRLGADTLCWHLRLETGNITMEEVLEEAAGTGAACVQVNLHHLRARDLGALETLAAHGRKLGLELLASGDFLGRGRDGDDPSVGIARINGWLDRARALDSPLLRVVSGFYRADLADRPELIEAERAYVSAVLRGAAPAAHAAGVRLLLENHSDFTVSEYEAIVAETGATDGGARVGVFLDLINPVAALEDPATAVTRLAPLAYAGHVKDYLFRSLPTDDAYHRRGFEVLYRYPGEGVADLPGLLGALQRGLGDRTFYLTVEGLDNRADVADQQERLLPSLTLLRKLLA